MTQSQVELAINTPLSKCQRGTGMLTETREPLQIFLLFCDDSSDENVIWMGLDADKQLRWKNLTADPDRPSDPGLLRRIICWSNEVFFRPVQ